jgi:hypothetical protein
VVMLGMGMPREATGGGRGKERLGVCARVEGDERGKKQRLREKVRCKWRENQQRSVHGTLCYAWGGLQGHPHLLVVDDKLDSDSSISRPPGVGRLPAVPDEVAGVARGRRAEHAVWLVVLCIVHMLDVVCCRHVFGSLDGGRINPLLQRLRA